MKKFKLDCKFKICMIVVVSMVTLGTMLANGQDYLLTSVNSTEKTIGWGIKRNDNHEQPDVGNANKEILEKDGGICLGNEKNKYIYLTFDSGYEAGYTGKILEVLKENNVKVTFFITAHYLNTQPEIVKQMIDDGHIIGNHTVNHKSMPSISDEEIEKEIMKLHQAVYDKFGYEMRYIRPPKGEFNERTLKKSLSLGYKTVMWSFAYVDWNENQQPSQEQALKTIINNFHPGEIMLLHSNSKTNSEILETIIKEAKKQGHEFKSLDEFQ